MALIQRTAFQRLEIEPALPLVLHFVPRVPRGPGCAIRLLALFRLSLEHHLLLLDLERELPHLLLEVVPGLRGPLVGLDEQPRHLRGHTVKGPEPRHFPL